MLEVETDLPFDSLDEPDRSEDIEICLFLIESFDDGGVINLGEKTCTKNRDVVIWGSTANC